MSVRDCDFVCSAGSSSNRFQGIISKREHFAFVVPAVTYWSINFDRFLGGRLQGRLS